MTMKTVLDQLTGRDIVEALIRVMEVNFEDFAEVRDRCHSALRTLQAELGEESIMEEMAAIERQTASDLVFSGFLGLKANLDYFIDPVGRNFMDVDPEIYLRENTARRLPEYEKAQEMRKRFYESLSPRQREVYADVTEYVSYLETVGPKLAHYWGFLAGNELLYRIVPGYHSDGALTARYCAMMTQLFGRSINAD